MCVANTKQLSERLKKSRESVGRLFHAQENALLPAVVSRYWGLWSILSLWIQRDRFDRAV